MRAFVPVGAITRYQCPLTGARRGLLLPPGTNVKPFVPGLAFPGTNAQRRHAPSASPVLYSLHPHRPSFSLVSFFSIHLYLFLIFLPLTSLLLQARGRCGGLPGRRRPWPGAACRCGGRPTAGCRGLPDGAGAEATRRSGATAPSCKLDCFL
jgi:hypothetical protein